jgi:3-hydroxyacyl-[acyl-carrier-protein] dehydratase
MDSETTTSEVSTADIVRIMEMIPHRYPFLMIDRMVEMVPDVSAVAIKNVSVNEPFFQGHFPGKPVMPGVLIIEAMAQAAAVLVVHTMGADAEGKLVYFMSVDQARFRKPITPGDSVRIHVKAAKPGQRLEVQRRSPRRRYLDGRSHICGYDREKLNDHSTPHCHYRRWRPNR